MYLMQTVSTVPRARPLPAQQPTAASPSPRSRSVDRGGDSTMLMFPESPRTTAAHEPGSPPPPPPDQRRRASGAAAVAVAGGIPDGVDGDKKKKWSLGGFFRRRRKTTAAPAEESESSSGEEAPTKRGFLSRRRSRRDKRKPRPKIVGTFDHIVVNPLSQSPMRARREVEVPPQTHSQPLVAGSPPSSPPQAHPTSRRRDSSLSRCSSGGSGSLDGTGRRSGRRGQAMARAEALRDQQRAESSSDDCGGFCQSPQTQRVRMDDSSPSTSRRSGRTAARTERHFRRLSRDEEQSIVDDAQSGGRTSSRTGTGRWTAVYHESCDTDPSLLTRTPSATPSPKQSPLVRPKQFRQYSPAASAVAVDAARTFPPGHGFWAGVRPPPPSAQGHPQFARNQPVVVPPTRPFQRGPSPGPGQRRADYTVAPPRPFPSYETVYAKPAVAAAPLETQRSVSYDCNIHRPTPLRAPSAVTGADDVLVVQFPIARLRPATTSPPPPPPRDPQRRLSAAPAPGASVEPLRPMSYAFEAGSPQAARVEYCLNQNPSAVASGSLRSLAPNSNSAWAYQRRSCSDNQLTAPNGRPRPASATPNEMYSATNGAMNYKSAESALPAHFQYYADQNPRSRRPIHIQLKGTNDQPYLSDSQVVMKPPYQKNPLSGATEFWKQRDQLHNNQWHPHEPQIQQNYQLQYQPNQQQLSYQQSQQNQSHHAPFPQFQGPTHSNRQPRKPVLSAAAAAAALGKPHLQSSAPPADRSRSNSPRPVDNTRVRTTKPRQIRAADSQNSLSGTSESTPGGDTSDLGPRPLSMVLETPAETSEVPHQRAAPPPPARRFSRQSSTSSLETADEEKSRRQRRSSNLEDALNELEAIYKSLRLGDEDLLDRAERREAPAYRPPPPAPEAAYPWRASARSGTESDSGFNYSGARSRLREAPDRVTDDMAYRRLNPKERPFSQDARALLSQSGSYLLASPALAQQANDGLPLPPPPPVPTDADEPDVTHDDVLFRSIKHANNTLRIADPQPLFGIPLGPVPPASNSDYLHATPVERPRSAFKPCKVPDVVKDDLAFRALRKDSQKDPALPPARVDDVDALFPARVDPSAPVTSASGNFSLRKKRAVRSLSANLMGLVNREPLVAPGVVATAAATTDDLEKAQSLSDLPDALQVAQKILEGKEAIGGGPAAALRRLAEAAVAGAAAEGIDPHYGVTPASWVERALLDRQGLCSATGASTSTETLTDSRTNISAGFPNSRRGSWQPRPSPTLPSTSRTTDPSPPAASEQSRLDELLSALAQEANATSERLDRELQQLRLEPETKLDANCNVVSAKPSQPSPISTHKSVSVSPTPITRSAPSPTPLPRAAPSPTPKPPASPISALKSTQSIPSPIIVPKTPALASAFKSPASPTSPSKSSASPTYFSKAASPTFVPRNLPSPVSISPTTVPKRLPSPRSLSPVAVPRPLPSPRSVSPTIVPRPLPSPRSVSPTTVPKTSTFQAVYKPDSSVSTVLRSPSPSATPTSSVITPSVPKSSGSPISTRISPSPTSMLKTVLGSTESAFKPLSKSSSPVPEPVPLRSPEAVAAVVAATSGVAIRPRTPSPPGNKLSEEPSVETADTKSSTDSLLKIEEPPRRHETVDDLVSQCRRDLDELLRQVDAVTRPPSTSSPEGEQASKAGSSGALASVPGPPGWAAGLEPLTALGVVLALLLSLLAMLAL